MLNRRLVVGFLEVNFSYFSCHEEDLSSSKLVLLNAQDDTSFTSLISKLLLLLLVAVDNIDALLLDTGDTCLANAETIESAFSKAASEMAVLLFILNALVSSL